MDKNLSFSIIVATYNRGHLISRTIQSVLDQIYPHFELIVVDDGSTDQTCEVVKKYNDTRIRYIIKENGERGAARNTGMDLARGEYITFLDSDDILYSNHLQLAAEQLSLLGEPHLYRQAYEVRDEKGRFLFANNKLKGDANRFILRGNYFSCIGVFLKKEITEKHRFNPDRNLPPSEDWEYWLRLSVRYKFYYNNIVTACMINHSGRSLNSFDEKRSRRVIMLLLQSLRADEEFMKERKPYLNWIRAHMYSMLCLNKVLHRRESGLYRDVIKTVKLSKSELLKRRTLAIMKYYLMNLLKR